MKRKKSSTTGRSQLFKLVLIFTIVAGMTCISEKAAPEDLSDGFTNPPNEAKPAAYYIMLNGYLNKDFVGQELEQYAEKGIGALLVFDMGIIGRKEFFPPAGPQFMSDEWLENFSYIVKKADELGMTVDLAACSSWDMGGSWVKPEEAVLALFQNSFTVTGPKKMTKKLPYPELPKTAILDSMGNPVVSKEVAVLAVPVKKRQPAFEFVFKLGNKAPYSLDHFILTNCKNNNPELASGENLFAKYFSIAASETGSKGGDFKEILTGTLQPNTKKQRFDSPETKARFIRLRIYNGYNTKADYVQLGEFEAFSASGENLTFRPHNKRSDGGMMLRFNSELGHQKKWTADNINDGKYCGDDGSWASNGKPPLLINDLDSIQLISDKLDVDGNLTWDVPEGEWEIIRYVATNTGEKLRIPNPASDGLATDHFSAKATRHHIQYMARKLKEKFGDLRESAINNFYLPSYEVRGMMWTFDLPEQFEKYRGYDMIKYLPALNGYVIGAEEITDRFLYDYQKTMGDILVDAFYVTANETAKKEGMAVKAEAAGPGPPDHLVPVEALKALSVVDAMQGEFWPWRPDWDALWVVKEIACAAHVYGRTLVHMESFTGFRHWKDGPVDLKPSADRAFCEGMNHIVWHMAEHTPPEAGKPGWAYNAGSHFNVNLVWWNYMKPWLDYLARTSFLLQQGLFVGDVVYYYGDKGANFIPPKHTNKSLDFGYDYDVTNLEVMLTRMDVQDNKIVLPDGMSYEVLVLPNQDDITLTALKRVKELVEKGATVIGPRPVKSTGLHNYQENDKAVKILADELWGNIDGRAVKENRYSKGKIVFGKTINTVLAERGVGPDFQFISKNNDTDLDFIHRRTRDDDIYFIRNIKARPEYVTAQFRVTGKTPHIWNAVDGTMRVQAVYEEAPDGIRLPLKLAANGSIFIVFRQSEKTPHLTMADPDIDVTSVDHNAAIITASANGSYKVKSNTGKTTEFDIKDMPAAIELTAPWTIHFAKGWGAPDSVETDELKSWTEFKNPGIQCFSGVATYQTEFNVPKNLIGEHKKLYLDLGDLWLLGNVSVNGKPLGVVWTPPYRVDITTVVQDGKNTLHVEIANTWSNRLIGDALYPNQKQYCRTNIDGHEILKNSSPGEAPLRKSGLFGPVTLAPAVERKIILVK